MSTHPEKKSERMEVRLGYAEKQAFVAACDVQGDTPSGAVRRFISGYTKRSTDDAMGEANRRLWRRYGLGVAGVSAALLLVAGAVLLGAQDRTPSRFMSASAFAKVDANADGTLDAKELGPRAEDLLRVLDLSSPPGIQLEEAVTRGRMSYSVSGPVALESQSDAVKMYFDGEMPVSVLVEFDLNEPAKTTVFTLRDGEGRFSPDRSVIWEEGRRTPKAVFNNADVVVGSEK